MHEDEITGKAYDSRLMRRLLGYAYPYRYHIAGAVVLTILISALGPLRPFLVKIAVDKYIMRGDGKGLLGIAGLLLLTLFFEAAIQYFMGYFTQWIGQKTIFDIRMQVYRKLLRLSLSFFDRNPVGRLVTRVTGDVEVLADMFSSGVVTVFADVFIILWIVVFMFAIDAGLALVTFATFPLLVYATFLFRRKVRESYRDIRLQVARLNSFTQERVSGIATMQLFTREVEDLRIHEGINRAHTDANVKSVYYHAVFFPVVDFLSALSIALIVWYAGSHILAGVMTVGTLISFIQYAEMFFRPVRDLAEKYNIMQTAMASSERIFKLLDDPTVIPDPPGDGAPLDLTAGVEFRNVSFSYNGVDHVVKHVSFVIPAGKTVAVVGATGAGKTTLVNLLGRQYDVDEGAILVGGKDVRDIPARVLRRVVGVVHQDVFLFSGDITSNITLGDETIGMERVREAARMAGADRFIERLPGRYGAEVKERGVTLSVGEKQLLAFARAIAYDPDILVLDEATSSVDTESERLIQEAVLRLFERRTSIVIAHRLSTIRSADHILVMHKGRIREEGTHQELLERGGIYTRLYQLQYKEQDEWSHRLGEGGAAAD
ncbi:MAG: ABC transporter ATP-binding protein [Bacteroidota bacterium]|nr:ABC transporter ATP-binding protein [Bacteroidota bacterium]